LLRQYTNDTPGSESTPETWQGQKVQQGHDDKARKYTRDKRMRKYIRVGKYTRDFKRSQVSYTRYTPEPESIQKTAGPDSNTRNQARPESTLGLRLG
jgi:hypothetical protein